VEEAVTKYGISVEGFTGKATSYRPDAKAAYSDGGRVAVTTYNSLFNSNPFFSDPDVIIIDDAHAAENYIANQWTLRINRLDEESQGLFLAASGVLKAVFTQSDYARLTGNGRNLGDTTWVDMIPTHKLVEIEGELRAAISENIGDNKLRFAWRMLSDHLRACHVYVSLSEILIRPLIPPTWTHGPYADAKQRIFMSATLGAGGDLERLTGRPEILRLPIPEGWDRQGIGRRLFIFPEKSLDEQATVALRHKLMKVAKRSLVLAPSNERVDEIATDVTQSLGYPIFTASDLEASKMAFTSSDVAIALVANRYDGIDFPDDDCRLVFVEGLPRASNLQERFLMTRMGANVIFNERVQSRVLQGIGRCTRGLNDYSAVVVTGEDLPDYLTDHRRRKYLHPELQAELTFGIEQSTGVTDGALLENFSILLKHEAEWEAANESILELRENAKQAEFPAMGELSAVVAHEIRYQAAMWQQDYVLAFDAARDVLGGLNDSGLRGYRALWHYLAGSAAELSVQQGNTGMRVQGQHQFKYAKEAAVGIPWLVSLARTRDAALSPQEQNDSIVMLQVERLEARLAKLGTLHNRTFSARESEIRSGLKTSMEFEQAHVQLGEHLGFIAGKMESDASPDPWWMIGDIVFVFEDHAGAKGDTSIVDAKKARQVACHPDWIREHVLGAKEAKIYPVLITPAKRATSGALPVLARVYYWGLLDFQSWAEQALVAVRDLRRTFIEPGDLDWRANAASALVAACADGPGLAARISANPARNYFEP
jgi:hypothetical protein